LKVAASRVKAWVLAKARVVVESVIAAGKADNVAYVAVTVSIV